MSDENIIFHICKHADWEAVNGLGVLQSRFSGE